LPKDRRSKNPNYWTLLVKAWPPLLHPLAEKVRRGKFLCFPRSLNKFHRQGKKKSREKKEEDEKRGVIQTMSTASSMKKGQKTYVCSRGAPQRRNMARESAGRGSISAAVNGTTPPLGRFVTMSKKHSLEETPGSFKGRRTREASEPEDAGGGKGRRELQLGHMSSISTTTRLLGRSWGIAEGEV